MTSGIRHDGIVCGCGDTVIMKEMIQIAFEYEVRIQQLSVELKNAQDKVKMLEQALASKVTTKE